MADKYGRTRLETPADREQNTRAQQRDAARDSRTAKKERHWNRITQLSATPAPTTKDEKEHPPTLIELYQEYDDFTNRMCHGKKNIVTYRRWLESKHGMPELLKTIKTYDFIHNQFGRMKRTRKRKRRNSKRR